MSGELKKKLRAVVVPCALSSALCAIFLSPDYLRAGLLLSDSFELSLLLAGALALLSLLSLLLDELTLSVDCLDDPDDSTLL